MCVNFLMPIDLFLNKFWFFASFSLFSILSYSIVAAVAVLFLSNKRIDTVTRTLWSKTHTHSETAVQMTNIIFFLIRGSCVYCCCCYSHPISLFILRGYIYNNVVVVIIIILDVHPLLCSFSSFSSLLFLSSAAAAGPLVYRLSLSCTHSLQLILLLNWDGPPPHPCPSNSVVTQSIQPSEI